MKILQIFAFTLLAGGSQVAVADQLSEDFKAAVESALKAPTAEEQIERLLEMTMFTGGRPKSYL